jgi:hypothetical protein
MARRSFRYNAELGRMVEIVRSDDPRLHSVIGEIEPFFVPGTNEVIKSRAHMHDYMTKHNLVHFDPTNKAESDRYAQARDDQARRELIWENIDRLKHTGRVEFKGPRHNEDDSL